MKKAILLAVLIHFLVTTKAQEKFSQIHSILTEFERVDIIRLQSGTDFLEGLKSAVKENSICNGVILTGIGSVSKYHYHVVSDKKLPPAEEYPKASVPMDLTSAQGYILNGRVHAHITLSDENSVVGGHLEPGTIALTFIIVTIGVLPDQLKMNNFDNHTY